MLQGFFPPPCGELGRGVPALLFSGQRNLGPNFVHDALAPGPKHAPQADRVAIGLGSNMQSTLLMGFNALKGVHPQAIL